ncbi:MAG: methylated-DNA--[protein]-cysteine S-methyltransferase [Desulfobulbaceae bacterium]|nr:methylated-DNA--[protein]-cysteine S-methyltransferase [Desulfobulbaceae bacterium]
MLSEKPSFTEIIYQRDTCIIHIITKGEQIVHLTFSEDHHFDAVHRLSSIFGFPVTQKDSDKAEPLRIQLDEYLTGRRRQLELPINPFFVDQATIFRQRVWQRLTAIPYGRTRSYGQIAAQLGNPACARAVGQACNANPLALIIPCHRVVGSRNTGGFSGGTAIKESLLQLEQNGEVI